MPDSQMRVLLVEDNPGDARLIRELLREPGSFPFELIHVERLAEARERVQEIEADVILLDLSLPDAQGMDTVRLMIEAAPEVPIIVLTGLADETTAVQAVQAGAQDFLLKGHVEGQVLARALRYARERKRLELDRARLLASEREARGQAEAAVRGRDEVLRVVAHDLGNSLSAVLVTTSVLLRTLPQDGAPDGARHRVENIRALVQHMQRLREDLLDVARLEAGQLLLERGPCGPGTVIEQSLERYMPVADERAISLTARVAPDLPRVFADESRLLQVMANLLTNALKFTPEGGSVEVRAELEPDGESVEFCVQDSGVGILPENLPRLFDRFWTIRDGNPSGAGLGLAIARGIVEEHGGRIWADSTPGQGTALRFTIPRRAPSPA